jgi:hypothetical protein
MGSWLVPLFVEPRLIGMLYPSGSPMFAAKKSARHSGRRLDSLFEVAPASIAALYLAPTASALLAVNAT